MWMRMMEMRSTVSIRPQRCSEVLRGHGDGLACWVIIRGTETEAAGDTRSVRDVYRTIASCMSVPGRHRRLLHIHKLPNPAD